MKPPRLTLVRFGSARRLTRDFICGPYVEIQIYDSAFPASA